MIPGYKCIIKRVSLSLKNHRYWTNLCQIVKHIRSQGNIANIMVSIKHWATWSLNSKKSLQWCHNGRTGVSNHQPHDCLLNRLFRRRSKKTSKLRIAGLCAGEFTGDWWIPRKNGQWRGKCFHLMMSSWSRPCMGWNFTCLCKKIAHEFCKIIETIAYRQHKFWRPFICQIPTYLVAKVESPLTNKPAFIHLYYP